MQQANNNLDVVDFDGRLFLSFRTAPSHFASPEVKLHIVSSKDEKTWDFETTIHMGTDLREPRFLTYSGKLYLYFAKLGKKRTAFEPGGMWSVQRQGPGSWTSPRQALNNDLIPWRIKTHNGVPILIGYTGGENEYTFTGDPIFVHLLSTTDGETWKPLDPAYPHVIKGGCSETDIAFDAEGNLFAVSRNEAGDKDGFGSKICRAPAGNLSNWTCRHDPRKYDSPLLFGHKGEIYLVGRRNVTPNGYYDLGTKGLTHAERHAKYLLDYWGRPKRCSVWFLNRDTVQIKHLIDLPSRGDTCFPSVVPRGAGRFLLFNYSSDVKGPDLSWNKGQEGPTHIYSMVVELHSDEK